MNTRSFSKEFPVGYQWIYIILLIVFLCFASVYNSYSAALNTPKLFKPELIKVVTETKSGKQDWMLNPDNFSPAPKSVTKK